MKPNPTSSFSCDFIASLDIDISQVLDIGVQSQTHVLRKFFKDKKQILIEPQKAYNELIESNYKGVDYILDNSACTNYNGEMYLHEEHHWGSKTPTHNHISTEKSQIKVKTKTLDRLCEEFNINKWSLLKIDVDGEEINILNSGLNNLYKFCFVIIECFIGRFTQINQILTDNDFSLFHINDICYIENMMCQFDAVYVNNEVKKMNDLLNPSFNLDTWHKHTV
jgi:FkbM family methyltransferase